MNARSTPPRTATRWNDTIHWTLGEPEPDWYLVFSPALMTEVTVALRAQFPSLSVRDVQEAVHDAVGSTFLVIKAHRRIERIGSYLLRAAHNQLCSTMKSSQRGESRREDIGRHLADLLGARGTPSDPDSTRTILGVAEAILTPTAFEVLRQRYLLGRKQCEIAKDLRLSEATVSKLLTESRTSLRTTLDGGLSSTRWTRRRRKP